MKVRFISRKVNPLSDHRMFCAAGGGAGNGAKPKPGVSCVEFNLNEARKALETSGPRDALMYLWTMIGAYSSHGQRSEALEIFDEGKRIFETANDPASFHWGLKIAAHGFKLGRSADAKQLFGQVLGWVQSRGSEYERDEIRDAVALTYIDLGETEEAVKIAEQIERMTPKFGILISVADSLIRRGDNDKAKDVLLNLCVVAARQPDRQQGWPRNTKIHRLLNIARRLINLYQTNDAEQLLKECAADIPDILDRREEDFKQLEDIAILLLKLGEKKKAINLLVDGWFFEDYLAKLTEGEREVKKLQLIREKESCARFAKALEAEETKTSI